ncbi:MAG TPA: hypothetical protein VGB30_04295 [bacterium]|jgi:Ca2+/Na+ antiporter
MEGIKIALAGGIMGTILGIAGGVLGTYAAIKNTKTPEERKYMVRAAASIWIALIVLIIFPLLLEFRGIIPTWGHWIGTSLFFLFLGPWILSVVRRSTELKKASPNPQV